MEVERPPAGALQCSPVGQQRLGGRGPWPRLAAGCGQERFYGCQERERNGRESNDEMRNKIEKNSA